MRLLIIAPIVKGDSYLDPDHSIERNISLYLFGGMAANLISSWIKFRIT
jgi:hypothetical protein